MKHPLRTLFAACLLAAAPFAAAERTQDAFAAVLAGMTPEQKVPLAKLAIAEANREIQKSIGSDPNIEQARITYEADNTVKYTIHMRHSNKAAELLADKERRQLFGQFMANGLKQHICFDGDKEKLRDLNLLGIERLHIQIHHERQPFSDSIFAIKECL